MNKESEIPGAKNYDSLLKLIRGETILGPGIRTYPNAPEENQKKLHEGCLELERQGLIYRAKAGEGWILWKVNDGL